MAFSASDCHAYLMQIVWEGKDPQVVHFRLGDVVALTISTHRDKFPIARLGEVNPIGFLAGHRAIAGSLVILMTDKSSLSQMLPILGKATSDRFSQEITPRPDELHPFDLLFIFLTEGGSYSAAVLRGVTVLDEGWNMNTNMPEPMVSFSWLATDYRFFHAEEIAETRIWPYDSSDAINAVLIERAKARRAVNLITGVVTGESSKHMVEPPPPDFGTDAYRLDGVPPLSPSWTLQDGTIVPSVKDEMLWRRISESWLSPPGVSISDMAQPLGQQIQEENLFGNTLRHERNERSISLLLEKDMSFTRHGLVVARDALKDAIVEPPAGLEGEMSYTAARYLMENQPPETKTNISVVVHGLTTTGNSQPFFQNLEDPDIFVQLAAPWEALTGWNFMREIGTGNLYPFDRTGIQQQPQTRVSVRWRQIPVPPPQDGG